MYRVRVTHEKSGEWTEFLGQGDSIESAFKDGVANAKSLFRPKNDGRTPIVQNVGVHSGDKVTLMPLKDFEKLTQQAERGIDLDLYDEL